MLSTVLAVIGIDLKREVKNISVTVVFAILGAFLTVLAVAIALRALYLWLELKLGIFPALGILGSASLIIAAALFGYAFMRKDAKPKVRPQNPLRASALSLADASEHAINEATGMVRHGSSKQVYSTILIAALAGVLVGRRFRN
jgi:hypothetical protein